MVSRTDNNDFLGVEKIRHVLTVLLLLFFSTGHSYVYSAAGSDEVVLPPPSPPFEGSIGSTYSDSQPVFPQHVSAPENAPNVVLVMTDDVGFAAASTFGGMIPTPSLDQLAANGVKYNRFHTTAMCSPSRAALLTGRNHHAVGSGIVTDLAAGYPGYSGKMPRSAASVAEVLKLNGYNTAMFGKHHNMEPGAGSATGPFDQWPVGLGFEYFYGFIGAQTNQFTPALYRGTSPVTAPEGVVLDKALIDDAINWLHNQNAVAPDKPFFLYYAPGTAHAPHQAPEEWIEKFRGRFDGGWDEWRADTFSRQKELGIIPSDTVLSSRPEGIPEWSVLTSDERKVLARQMEVYAAMLAHQDMQFGRLVIELERMGKLDNTLVIFVQGDNGASPEGGVSGHSNPMGSFANAVVETLTEQVNRLDEQGGPNTTQNYSAGWAWAHNTPFQWAKHYASHLGGTRNGLVISWPEGIDSRGIRSQFHHLIDIAPTILDVAGLPQPDVVNGVPQQRVDGVSMAYSFNSADAPGQRVTQYFEMLGKRAIFHRGWMAATRPPRALWQAEPLYTSNSPLDYEWELYHLDEDFSQSQNLAESNPAKLKELKAVFDREAARNNVLPLDDRMNVARLATAAEAGMKARSSYTYWGRDIIVPAAHAPSFKESFTLTAMVNTSAGSTDGVLAALGSHFAGWSFYLKNGKPVVVMAGSNQPERIFRIESEQPVPLGDSTIEYDFSSDGIGKGGMMRININGQLVGEGRIEKPIFRTVEMTDTFDIGVDTNTPVTDDYQRGGRFAGEIQKLTVTVSSKN